MSLIWEDPAKFIPCLTQFAGSFAPFELEMGSALWLLMTSSSFSLAISEWHWICAFPLQSLLKMLWISLTSGTHSIYSQGLWNLKATALYWLGCKNQPRIIWGFFDFEQLQGWSRVPHNPLKPTWFTCLVVGDVHNFIDCHLKWFLRLFKATLLFSWTNMSTSLCGWALWAAHRPQAWLLSTPKGLKHQNWSV